MTKINRMSIHGFKSFAHKTEIPFQEKFNVILGPNGSGKSNIGDALCFVLGRLSAKSLRAEKAANLLFNGGKDKKPAASASVEIAFDNTSKIFPEPAPEIVLSRTINQDGNSTYRVNGKKRTRTEILDLLAAAKINPDGYNIILQGDITRFVDMHPIERRQIIEEISDVTVYEEKKHKALLELEKVEEKLNNAEIILKERKTYLNELKKDRDQALKFKDLKNHIDSSKATLLYRQLQEKEEQQAKLEKDLGQFQQKISSAEKEIEKHKVKIAEQKQQIAQLNQQIEQKGEKEQLKVHRDIEELKVSLAQDKTRISSLKDEINKIQQRKDKLREDLREVEERSSSTAEQQKELQQRLKQKGKELQDLEEQLTQFKKKNKIESSQELDRELEEKDKLIEQKQEEVQKVRQRQQDLLREKDKLDYQLQNLEERLKKVREVEEQNQEKVKELQQRKSEFKSLTLRLNQGLDQDSSLAAQLQQARKRQAEIQEKQAGLAAQAATARAQWGSNEALKSILQNRKKFKGSVHGTIAELGQVERRYALALEAAAGNRMQHVVVDNDETAADCIKFLKSNKLGTASFIPLNKIKSREISSEDKKLLKQLKQDKNEGVHDFAINAVSFQPQFRKAFEHVFADTLIVEDIDTARKVGIGRLKMATLDGNIAEASGVMKGGFMQRKAAAGFAEKDAREELEKVGQELEEAEKLLTSLTTKRERNEREIEGLRKSRAEREAHVITLEKTLHLEDADLSASSELKKEFQSSLKKVEEELAGLQKQIAAINKDLAEAKSRKQQLRLQASELRNPRLLAQLTAFEESRQKTREELVRLEQELKNISQHQQELFTPEQEKIKEILKQHDKEEAQFSVEIRQLSPRIKDNEQQLGKKEKESSEFYSKYRELFTRREKFNAEIAKAENEIENGREKARSGERELNLLSLKNAEIKAKVAGLQEEFSRYNRSKEVELFKNKSVSELQEEVKKFERLLSEMSAVNMKALEVYEQIEKEFNQLLEKKEELGKEKTDVLTMMNEIEIRKKDHFMRTFERANDNFQRIFGNLFKKGKAALQLDNEKNPFDDGLSIKVKLTGNRYLDIKSLSGGEKTLTALSFIFAIQEYQPSSFYILDEVDAALDKQNSETLSRLVRSYSDRAQYILISHNDALISEADTLFGISMNEGVSKVTSLRI